MTVIYDPATPTWLFDGLLDCFSTCRDCGTTMRVINAEQRSHPCCAIVETQLESMADLLTSELGREDWAQAELTEQMMNDVAVLELGQHATIFTEWGWPVFPLGKRSKAPAIPKAKGGQGFKDATNNTARIQKWWTRHPDHNIGLATGHEFDVIDIDTKEADKVTPTTVGLESFFNLLNAKAIPEVHGIAITATGGMHLYVKPTGKGNFAGIRPGIDYRGRGGYVVAPPSQLRGKGRQYTWLVEPSPIIKGVF